LISTKSLFEAIPYNNEQVLSIRILFSILNGNESFRAFPVFNNKFLFLAYYFNDDYWGLYNIEDNNNVFSVGKLPKNKNSRYAA